MYHRGAGTARCDRGAVTGAVDQQGQCYKKEKSYGAGLFTLEAASWRFSSRSWTTRSPGQGIAALSDVKVGICAPSCLQRQLVCSSGSSGMREVAAAGLWQQPVERRVGQEGKVGPAKRVPYARVSTCHYSQHSGSRSGSVSSKIKDQYQSSGSKTRIIQESGSRKMIQEQSLPSSYRTSVIHFS